MNDLSWSNLEQTYILRAVIVKLRCFIDVWWLLHRVANFAKHHDFAIFICKLVKGERVIIKLKKFPSWTCEQRILMSFKIIDIVREYLFFFRNFFVISICCGHDFGVHTFIFADINRIHWFSDFTNIIKLWLIIANLRKVVLMILINIALWFFFNILNFDFNGLLLLLLVLK